MNSDLVRISAVAAVLVAVSWLSYVLLSALKNVLVSHGVWIALGLLVFAAVAFAYMERNKT